MKKRITTNILAALSLVFVFSACETEDNFGDKSVKASEPTITIDIGGVTDEVFTENDEAEYPFTITLSEKQIVDVYVNVTATGTATEGADFDYTHVVTIPKGFLSSSGTISFAGDDGEFEGDETVTLTIGVDVSNADVTPVVVDFTIEDSTVPADFATIGLSWDFSDAALADLNVCDYGYSASTRPNGIDIDLTIIPNGGDVYGDDLLGNGASTTACGEHGDISLADMNDGEVYEIWALKYGTTPDFGDLSLLNLTLTFERGNSDLSGDFTIEEAFDTRDDSVGGVIGTIEKNGDILTVKNTDGDVIGEGKIGPKISVTKPAL